VTSVVGNSEDDWRGVVEVQQTEELAAGATVTEVKADKVPILEPLLSLAQGRTGPLLRQRGGHPERGQ
jgi:hypothetical protein